MTVATKAVARQRDPAVWLWTVAAAGWVGLLALTVWPPGMLAMPAMASAHLAEGASTAGLVGGVAGLVAFIGGWVVMVSAMMLPTTVPMARLFTVVTSDVPSRFGVRAAFYGSYVVVWAAAGMVGLAVAVLVAKTTSDLPPGVVLGAALVLAGGFQFSPLKANCLTLCREPRAFLFTHYRRGVGPACELGLRHAIACLGCCWALMAVMFAVGSGDVAWMLGLTAVMVAEKTAPWGRRLVKPLGVLLLAAGLLVGGLSLIPPSDSPTSLPTPAHHHM